MAEANDQLAIAAEAIAKLKGDSDPANSDLIKSLENVLAVLGTSVNANAKMVDVLAKGSDADDDDDDDDEDEESEQDDDDDDDDDAGYRDMRMSAQPEMFGPDEGYDDVTADVAELRKAVASVQDTLGRISEQLALLGSMTYGQFEATDKLAKAQASAIVQLGKSVLTTQTALSRTAAPGITPSHFPPTRTTEDDPPVDDVWIGGSEEAEARKLFKAKARGIIDDGQYRSFLHTKRFSLDTALHTRILAQVAAVAS